MSEPLEVGEMVAAMQGDEEIDFVYDGQDADDPYVCWLVTEMGERIIAPILAVYRPEDNNKEERHDG